LRDDARMGESQLSELRNMRVLLEEGWHTHLVRLNPGEHLRPEAQNHPN
jgi:hypothetical protein